jgi:hypothetical protein
MLHKLFLIPIFLFRIIIIRNIYDENPKGAMNLMRLYFLSSFVFLELSLTSNILIIMMTLSIITIYLLTFLGGIAKGVGRLGYVKNKVAD